MEIAPRRVHITNALFDTIDLFKLCPCGVTRREKGGKWKVKECCGNCKFNKYGDGDFFCSNEESDVYGCETSYNEKCEDFEEEDEEC